jgi:prefoldin subunit 5
MSLNPYIRPMRRFERSASAEDHVADYFEAQIDALKHSIEAKNDMIHQLQLEIQELQRQNLQHEHAMKSMIHDAHLGAIEP